MLGSSFVQTTLCGEWVSLALTARDRIDQSALDACFRHPRCVILGWQHACQRATRDTSLLILPDQNMFPPN